MNLAKTFLSSTFALLLVGGCGRSDAAAASASAAGGATPADDKKTETVVGPTAAGDSWKVEAKVLAPAKATDKQWTLEVVLRADAAAKYHVNTDYPYKFKAAGTNVEFEKVDVKKDDQAFKLDKCTKGEKGDECTELHLLLKFTPSDPKAAAAGGELKFGVCNPDKCKMDKAVLKVDVSKVKAPV
ncbi:MAG: hypothetical protein NVS3B10_08490 [Polyangiales bacterium]